MKTYVFSDEHNCDHTYVLAADAQATVEALQAVIRQMGEQAAVLAKDGMAAKAQVEALQRVRDEANLYRDQARANQESLAACVDRDVRKIKDLQAALDAEREKVKGLHEITKVICAHCCEPMEIPSKAALQTQLTQLQALMRAFFTSEDKWAVAYRELERLGYTLDATTPAPDTSIIGKCEPPSQWDPNAQVRGDIS